MLAFFFPLKIRTYFIDVFTIIFFNIVFCILLYFYFFNWTWIDIFGLPVYTIIKKSLLSLPFNSSYEFFEMPWFLIDNTAFNYIFSIMANNIYENDYKDELTDWFINTYWIAESSKNWINFIKNTETFLLPKSLQNDLWILTIFDYNQYSVIFSYFYNLFNFIIYFFWCFIKWIIFSTAGWSMFTFAEVVIYFSHQLLGKETFHIPFNFPFFDKTLAYDFIFPMICYAFYNYTIFASNSVLFIISFLTKDFFYIIFFAIFFLKTYWIWDDFIIPLFNWLLLKVLYTPNSYIVTINSHYKHFAIFKAVVKLKEKIVTYTNIIPPIILLLCFFIYTDYTRECIVFILYCFLFCLFFTLKNFMLTLLYFFRFYFFFLTYRFPNFTVSFYRTLQLINFFIIFSIIFLILNLWQIFVLKNIEFTFNNTLKFFYCFLFITLLIQIFSNLCLTIHKLYFSRNVDIYSDYFYFFKNLKNYLTIQSFIDNLKRAYKKNIFWQQVAFDCYRFVLLGPKGGYMFIAKIIFENYLHLYYRKLFNFFFPISHFLNMSSDLYYSNTYNYNILIQYILNYKNTLSKKVYYNLKVATNLFLPRNYFQQINVKFFNSNITNPTLYKPTFNKKIKYLQYNTASWHNKPMSINYNFDLKLFNTPITRVQIKTLKKPTLSDLIDLNRDWLSNINIIFPFCKRVLYYKLRRLLLQKHKKYKRFKPPIADTRFALLFFKHAAPTIFLEKWSFWYNLLAKQIKSLPPISINSKNKVEINKKLNMPLFCQVINQFNIYNRLFVKSKILQPTFFKKIVRHFMFKKLLYTTITIKNELIENLFNELYISPQQKYAHFFKTHQNPHQNTYKKTVLNIYKKTPFQYSTFTKIFLHNSSPIIKQTYAIKKIQISWKTWLLKKRFYINPTQETQALWFGNIDFATYEQFHYRRQYWIPHTKFFYQPQNTQQTHLKTTLKNTFLNSKIVFQTQAEKNNLLLNSVFQPKDTYFISLTTHKNFTFVKFFYKYTFFNKSFNFLSQYKWTKNWLYLKSFKIPGTYEYLQNLINIIPGFYKISTHKVVKAFLYNTTALTTFTQQTNKSLLYKINTLFDASLTKPMNKNLLAFRLQYFQFIEHTRYRFSEEMINAAERNVKTDNQPTAFAWSFCTYLDQFNLLNKLAELGTVMGERMFILHWHWSFIYDPQVKFAGPWLHINKSGLLGKKFLLKDIKILKKNKKFKKLVGIYLS